MTNKIIGKNGRPITIDRKISRGTRRQIYKSDKYECVYCRLKVIPDYEFAECEKHDFPDIATIDHVIPGIYDFNNLVTSCYSCNSKKSNRTPAEANMKLIYGRFSEKEYVA